MAVRYAARAPEQLRSREVEKTSVGAWSTVLVATFETDPDVILASVLPKTPRARRETAGQGHLRHRRHPRPAHLRGRQLLGPVQPRGHPRLLLPGHAHEHRAVGHRRPRDLRRAQEDRPGHGGRRRRRGARHHDPYGRHLRRVHRRVHRDARGARRPRRGRTSTSRPSPRPTARASTADPSLVYCTREETVRWVKACEGELVLRDSRFDPVADLPVRSLVEVTVGERNAIQRGPHPLDGAGRLDHSRSCTSATTTCPLWARTSDSRWTTRARWPSSPAGPGASAGDSSTPCSPRCPGGRRRRGGRRPRRRRRRPGAPTAGSVRASVTDVADPDSVEALADDVYGTEGRCDLLFANAGVTSGGGGPAVGAGDQRLALVLLGERLRRGRHRPHLPAEDARGGDSRRDRRHLVRRRRGGPGALRQRLRLLQGRGQLLHRSRRPPAPHDRGRRSGPTSSTPVGVSSTPACGPRPATAPPSSSGSGPGRPPRGRRSPSSRPSSKRPGSRPRSSTSTGSGAKVLEDLDDGRYILGPDAEPLRRRLLHARADAIAKGELPPTLLH